MNTLFMVIKVYYLKCKKVNSDFTFYIWANNDNINEWCISEKPCGFKEYEKVVELFNLIRNKTTSIVDVEVVSDINHK